MNKTFSRSLPVLGLLLFFGSTAVFADEATDDPVVARVNGDVVYESELMAAAAALPAQYQANIAAILPTLLDRIVDLRLVVSAGKSAGLLEEADVQMRLDAARDQVISQVYIERQLTERVTDEVLQERYQEMVGELAVEREVHARHILLETEEEAKEVIGELDGGADFATLAQERSTGPSGPQGGDLGFFAKGQMVAPFAEAAFALEPGSYTKEPVQTQFGFHVILVEEARDQEQPSFAEMEPQIREQLTGAGLEEVLSELREGAEIEILLSEEAQGGGSSAEEAE
jgi:peptidyl-prolyl cis-trans isomerase C